MSELNEHRIRVSQTAKVRPGVFRAQVSVVYAGMINESTYSIAVLWSYGHNSMAYNLYLPKNQTEIEIPKGRLEVLYVSKDEIQFKYIETE